MSPTRPSIGLGLPEPLGVTLVDEGVNIAVFARHADCVFICLFDEGGEAERARMALPGRTGDIHHGFVPGVVAGTRYGLRAQGPFDPANGHRYDLSKLLVDPYARLLDRPFRYVAELAAPPTANIDTAPFVPRAVVPAIAPPVEERLARSTTPGLIYEVGIKAFSKRNPDIPTPLRGTLAALATPAVIEHLHTLGVTHVELMPIAAWMDERLLPPLGLANAWGYNPLAFMAPDPRLVPGGLDDLRNTVAALREAEIRVILDVVYNHTAEGDEVGPTVSLRGLDSAVYYRHEAGSPGRLVNDTACGNTLACDRAPVIRLVTDAMRHWVEAVGIDGFRFDLATVLGRSERGFSAEGPLLAAILQDPVLREIVLIAEPWDVGPGGYQLGNYASPFLEWNDKFRDDMRRFWKSEAGPGALATRLAGSSDVFQASHRGPSSSVNFITCHDGFTLADLVAYGNKHNGANGQDNRDGSNDNYSWNNGVEGPSADAAVNDKRARDKRALLASLFLSRGTPMLAAGDEFGHTQKGNNNAYCQDNEITWLDWPNADRALLTFVAGLSRLRRAHATLRRDAFYSGKALEPGGPPDVQWLDAAGQTMSIDEWGRADVLAVGLASPSCEGGERLFVVMNRSSQAIAVSLPEVAEGGWSPILDSAAGFVGAGQPVRARRVTISGRCVAAFAAT
jgi:glycogen debranching enzyme